MGGGREEGKGRAPPLRCKHGTMSDIRVLAYAHSSLTIPPPASVRAPPPFLAHHYCYRCLSHTMRGALCCGGRLRGGVDRQAGPRRLLWLQPCLYIGAPWPGPLAPACVTRTPPQTNQAPNCKLEAHAGREHSVPKCTRRLAGRVHHLDAQELLCSAHITLCSNDMLSH